LSDIDRVCTDVGIMHDGKIIYCGSVRDLKKTIGRNMVELELDGDDAAVDSFCTKLGGEWGILGSQRTGAWLQLRFDPEAPIAVPIARVLDLATEMSIDVLSISSARAQTEDAFIRLLEVDQADGFSRAYGALPALPHGVERLAEGRPQ
jgi:ABC-type multidrug transport system ATPase subunit